MSPAIKEMRAAVADLRREIARIEARIYDAEGKPRAARFHRIVAGDEEGSGEAARLEMRAEQYLTERRFYMCDTAEDREAILDLVRAMEAGHAA